MRIKAKLKTNLEIGRGVPFFVLDRNVEIVYHEDHPIFGSRYKVFGYDDWFEENAFEFIGEDQDESK